MSSNRLECPPQLGPVKITLEVLGLGANQISWIDSDYFNGFKKLRVVHLNNNRLQSVPYLISLQTTLQDVRFDYNKVKNIDRIYNSGTFMSLQRLSLSSNSIASFNVSVFLNMPNLSYISLFKNDLTTLSDPRLHFKGSIKLSGNPWHCDPSISWMPSMTSLSARLVCESPPCLRGNVIKHMSNKNNSQYVVNISK